MTVKELSQLYYLNREIEQDKNRLAELEAAATSCTAKITGLPHVQGIADKTALAAEIADCQAVIELKSKQSLIEYNRIMRFVAGINDSQMRQIVALRHANGLSWRQVAFHIGGGNTEGSVKMAYKRYFEKENNNAYQ